MNRRNIPGPERTAYRKAVECLMNAPQVYENVTDGPRSLFDSFGVLHYYLTPAVHNSAYFLLFHRLYVWTFEEKLRTECGYTGAFPYWEVSIEPQLCSPFFRSRHFLHFSSPFPKPRILTRS